jgi:hypothetical protein
MELVRAEVDRAAFLCAYCDQQDNLPYVLRLLLRDELPEKG